MKDSESTDRKFLFYHFSYFLMALHILYLGLIPFAAMISAEKLGMKSGGMMGVGWIPGIIFFGVLVQGYHLTRQPIKALLIVLQIPVLVSAHIYFVGGGMYEFLLEEAAIEIITINVAATIAMGIYKPSGMTGFWVGVIICLLTFGLFGKPIIHIYKKLDYEWYWWLLLIGSFLMGTFNFYLLVKDAARLNQGFLSDKDGGHGHSVLANFFFGRDGEYVSLQLSEGGRSILLMSYLALWLILSILISNLVDKI